MSSELIPSSQGPDSTASEQALIETSSEGTKANRHQPIPPPSEPMQYRAIGLVRGLYQASAEQLTQGTLVTTDGTELKAVLLGRIISLVKNHIDLAQEHLWVVYPRTGQREDNLHLQIVGVWEPENLRKELPAIQRPQLEEESISEEVTVTPAQIEDGYFSVRGEVVYQSSSNNEIVVKIKQTPRKESDKPKYFKLKLQGMVKPKAVGQFWDFQAQRQADNLVIQECEAIAVLPRPQKPRRSKPYQARGPITKSKPEISRPVRKTGDPITRPIQKSPTPKPTKRPKPPQ